MALIVAKTGKGHISGVRGGNPIISVFKGIPFAKPPIGSRRWKKPEEADSWSGVYHADHFKNIAAQEQETHPFFIKEFYPYRYSMNEDCLYLNIWTPAENDNENLPVLVFIHGGGFKSGYSYEREMDGEYLAMKGVILVTISYRLSSFGFLAHSDLEDDEIEGSCGNYGIADQISAIKWIYDNIAAFGGNPDNITIFGQSAGSMSVQDLVVSSHAKPFIAKAIMESGGGFPGPALRTRSKEEAEEIGDEFIAYIGSPSVDEARKIPAEQIAIKSREFCTNIEPGFSFSPISDGFYISEDVKSLYRKHLFKNIPYIVGFNSTENTPNTIFPINDTEFYKNEYKKIYGKDVDKFLNLIDFDKNPKKAIYDGQWNDLLIPPSIAFCEDAVLNERNQPVYLYNFNRKLPGDEMGAFHSAELWYVFHTLDRCWRPLTGQDYDLSEQIVNFWVNFAKNGDPNGKGLPNWSPYTASNRKAMRLDISSEMTAQFASKRMWFIADHILSENT